MVTEIEATAGTSQKSEPRSLAIAEAGIGTGNDFARCMSALMSDIIASRVTPQVGNAVCNAGGKLLKVVELQLRYGSAKEPNGERILHLTPTMDIGVGK
jgi:hypothetical protein